MRPGRRRAGAPSPRDVTLIDGLAVAKECDEFVYAATYMPDWLYAPHAGMRRLIVGEDDRGSGVGTVATEASDRPSTGSKISIASRSEPPSSTGTTAQGRRLPFRGPTDPYLVLVSETILQQTQVARGGPAWEAFVARFPTVEALAAASPADVLRAWRGLGYNRRAISLQRAARIVVGELGGEFPRDVAGLERLPGVGPYTARAIASIAFALPVGAVDTNVRRVLGRVGRGRSRGGSRAGSPGAGRRPRDDRSAGTGSRLDPCPDGPWLHGLRAASAAL